jgi:hypothetical protein
MTLSKITVIATAAAFMGTLKLSIRHRSLICKSY